MLMKTQIYVVTIWMAGENGPKFSIPKVTGSCLNAAALMKVALE